MDFDLCECTYIGDALYRYSITMYSRFLSVCLSVRLSHCERVDFVSSIKLLQFTNDNCLDISLVQYSFLLRGATKFWREGHQRTKWRRLLTHKMIAVENGAS